LNLGIEPLPDSGVDGSEHLQKWLHARRGWGRKARGSPPGRRSAAGPPARWGAALGPPSARPAPRVPQTQGGAAVLFVPRSQSSGGFGLGLGLRTAPSLDLNLGPGTCPVDPTARLRRPRGLGLAKPGPLRLCGFRPPRGVRPRGPLRRNIATREPRSR
jgi:hypothetical protein